MGTIEQISKMKQQGFSDRDIVNSLRERGVSPREIDDAMNNLQVKNAVSGEEFSEYSNEPSFSGDMQPSVIGEQNSSEDSEQYYYPQTQETEEQAPIPQEYYQPQPQYETQYDQSSQSQEYYQPQQYDYSYANQGVGGTEMMIEIAEQVFSNKFAEIQVQLEELNEFKSITKTQVENMSERLRKMESIIDKLQMAILEKVSSYGKNLDSIKKEMTMMQESFTKVVPELVKKSVRKETTSKRKSKK